MPALLDNMHKSAYASTCINSQPSQVCPRVAEPVEYRGPVARHRRAEQETSNDAARSRSMVRLHEVARPRGAMGSAAPGCGVRKPGRAYAAARPRHHIQISFKRGKSTGRPGLRL